MIFLPPVCSHLSAAFAVALTFLPGPAWAVEKPDFNRDIRPILSDNCFACHGPDTQKIKGGLRLDLRENALRPAKSDSPAIVPGKPAESELVRRIRTADQDDIMPPPESHKVLSPAQRDLLEAWIRDGAEYQGHWSYQPPIRPATPPGPTAIDHLVAKRLQALGLQPSPEADRRTLARRLHLDLIGLPASPVDVERFERDTAPGAYERFVDQLLSSPHFGERMAIAWLDVVRFADTIGYHSDNPRNIWPYRDYVIQSFNRNKPFDVFTREQLAGDLLPGAGLEQLVGSAFNRLLLTTEEGGAQPKDYESRYLTDRVRAVGSVWLGQTIGCAQCHDHKFDPITARDFYAMGAFFADVRETIIGRREDGMLVPDATQERDLHRRRGLVSGLEALFQGPHPELAAEQATWEAQQQQAVASDALWNPLHPVSAESTGGATLKIRDDHSILASGKAPDTDAYRIAFTNTPSAFTGLRIEVLNDDSLPSKGPGRAGNGNFVLTEVLARVERDGVETIPLGFQQAQATHEQTILADQNPYGAWTAASTIDADVRGTSAGWAILPHVGKPQQLVLAFKQRVELAPSDRLVVELQQAHGNGHHTIGRFRISASDHPAAVASLAALPPAPELAAIFRKSPAERDDAEREKLNIEFRKITPSLDSQRSLLAVARKELADLESALPRCLVTVAGEPRTVRILPRGNWLVETGETVEPALPFFLAANFPSPARRLNRLDLADWIVSRDNPLTARVVMNRLWRQFFGIGLSKVPDDLGAQGETPVHPELLDWLACEFRDGGWNMRHMVRTLVLSKTYRQVSTAPRERWAIDPENRDLDRQSRWRIEAELVRDTALSLSGLLVPVVGGPSAHPYQPDGYWENLNFPTRTYQASTNSQQYRRGLYTWWQRSYAHPSMLAFDAPAREECTAERPRSNIPQQALVLLNDPTYVEAARAFAVRILRHSPAAGPDPIASRIQWAWTQALARKPTPEELATLAQLLQQQLSDYRRDPEAARAYLKTGLYPAPEDLDPAELAAWTDIARAILNLHETITRS